jgi:hypothetical protein
MTIMQRARFKCNTRSHSKLCISIYFRYYMRAKRFRYVTKVTAKSSTLHFEQCWRVRAW